MLKHKPIRFTKMHGLGNDFMVIDAINQHVDLAPDQIRDLSHRHTGVGFDQCLLIEPPRDQESAFFYRIFNADGSEVGQCGNGARCVARFLHHYGLIEENKVVISTFSTRMHLTILPDHRVTVEMNVPEFSPAKIPLATIQAQPPYTLFVQEMPYQFHAVNVGNPHAIIAVSDVMSVDVSTVGRKLTADVFFPEQINVGFMQIKSADHIALRVYERGCGETPACGSGAVAAAAVAQHFYHLNQRVTVSLPGGDLIVNWPDPSAGIQLTGPATFVYEGQLI